VTFYLVAVRRWAAKLCFLWSALGLAVIAILVGGRIAPAIVQDKGPAATPGSSGPNFQALLKTRDLAALSLWIGCFDSSRPKCPVEEGLTRKALFDKDRPARDSNICESWPRKAGVQEAVT